ncbi:hypothetical protein Pcinc_030835 [Petrolisthes cinctipes]|uniref:VCBS repeat-containing protein n=1 Tax=Petrolisthes cinctipes TaxID=88211 RepID=A0AAE1EXB4_PETCI|nr:hypothetical protein Pcinc_030835 [Petrolisthes cinctipes]
MQGMWCWVVASAVTVVVAAGDSTNNGKGRLEQPDWQPRSLGTVDLRHPAFIEAYFSEDDTLEYADRWSIYISTFDSLSGLDEVYRIRSPGRYLNDISGWTIEQIDQSAYWPNNPDYLPSSVAGAEGVVWSSGFLVPGKKAGQLQLYDTSNPLGLISGPYNIASLDTEEWSYHRTIWKDMDMDGDLDALTARFHTRVIGSILIQLVYLENPNTGFSEGWTQHVLATDGPDVSFDLVTLSAGGRTYDCVVVGEFWNQRTSIYWTESETNDWSDTSLIKSRIINPEAGQVFDVLVDDFNRDGELEFIATEYLTDLGVGQVSVYMFPTDFRTDNFTYFKIADGFRPNQILGAQTMSPGTPKTYYPTQAYAEDVADDGLPHKPYILVSGDDDGRTYILMPNSDVRDDWVYQKHILVDTMETTVGKMAHGDFDGDGYEEVVVAGYSAGKLFAFTYTP